MDITVVMNGVGIEKIVWSGLMADGRYRSQSFDLFLTHGHLEGVCALRIDTIVLEIDHTFDILCDSSQYSSCVCRMTHCRCYDHLVIQKVETWEMDGGMQRIGKCKKLQRNV